jgi:hypothetical protein
MRRAREECEQKMGAYGQDLDKTMNGAIHAAISADEHRASCFKLNADKHRVEQEGPKPQDTTRSCSKPRSRSRRKIVISEVTVN